MCYLQLGSSTEAIKMYNKSFKISSCDIGANYALGLIYKRGEELNDATRYLSRLISIVDSKLSGDLETDIYLHIEKIKAMALISKEQANEYVDSLLSIRVSKEVNFVLH